MRVLPPKAVEGIAQYEYKSGPYSFFDNLLTPYWNFCVTLLPKWMAPNLVTLCGTIVSIGSTLVMNYYSPHLEGELVPTWVFWLCAVSLFAYQTLDAIDGKQARRTGSSSPLGQLFDHGCDSMNVAFNVAAAATGCSTGSTWMTVAILYAVAVPFYLAMIEEYHTGLMKTTDGLTGVTEGQLMLVLIHIICATIGPQVFQIQPLPFLPLSIKEYLLTFVAVLNGIFCLRNIYMLTKLTGNELSPKDRGHKRLGKKNALLQIVPAMWIFICGVLWIIGDGNVLYQKYPLLFVYALGIASSYMTTLTIVSHMGKCEPPVLRRLVIPITLAVINTHARTLRIASGPLVNETLVFALCVAWFASAYLCYAIVAVNEIAKHLKIYVFVLGKRKED